VLVKSAARGVPLGAVEQPRPVEPRELAWMLLLPCALLTAAAIAVLGPPLGHLLPAASPRAFWRHVWLRPEPVEHARYLLALAGAGLLAGLVLAGARRRLRLSPSRIRALTLAGQLVLCAALVVCVLAQYDVVLPSRLHFGSVIFRPRTLVVAAVIALALPPLLRRWARRARRDRVGEGRARRAAWLALAAACTAIWLLSAIYTDRTVDHMVAWNLLPWSANETYAVLDGRTPLVDFHAQYGQLLPYLAAAVLALVGTSMTVWTALMAIFSGLALLAVYGVLRRIVRSSPLSLALYLPFLASAFYIVIGTPANRFSPGNTFSLWPMRYAGALLLAWLTARHLGGAAPRRRALLFLAGGLVAINNVDFGGAALVATLVAVAARGTPRSWPALARVLGAAVTGVLGAAAAVCALTLARAGTLPDLGLLREFPRFYAIDGWAMSPMPLAGVHLALYATFVAAIVTAVVRIARGDDEPVLTGMLAWSGVFGLLTGAYFVGLSVPGYLIALFPAWCFALVLLLVAAGRGLAARGWRRPAPAEIALLFGFGVSLCSLAQVPTPWSQVARLQDAARVQRYRPPDAVRMIARDTFPHSEVALLVPFGHRLAYDLGRTNISPYSGIESMPTRRQVRDTIALLRRRHVHQVFLALGDPSIGNTLGEIGRAFIRAGFRLSAQADEVIELSDAARPARG
jgi:hypothetical protein